MATRRRVRVDTGEPVARPDFSGSAKPRAAAPEPPPDPEACDCPRLERDDWHEVESDWSDAAFLGTSLTAVAGVPLGYVDARHALEQKAEALGLTVPADAMALLGEGRFRRRLMLEVEGTPSGGEKLDRPGGVAFTRLVPAPMGQIRKVVEDTEKLAKERYGRKPDSTWLWYLTCRICSEARAFETLVVAHYRG
jgi:hypothetical protein